METLCPWPILLLRSLHEMLMFNPDTPFKFCFRIKELLHCAVFNRIALLHTFNTKTPFNFLSPSKPDLQRPKAPFCIKSCAEKQPSVIPVNLIYWASELMSGVWLQPSLATSQCCRVAQHHHIVARVWGR